MGLTHKEYEALSPAEKQKFAANASPLDLAQAMHGTAPNESHTPSNFAPMVKAKESKLFYIKAIGIAVLCIAVVILGFIIFWPPLKSPESDKIKTGTVTVSKSPEEFLRIHIVDTLTADTSILDNSPSQSRAKIILNDMIAEIMAIPAPPSASTNPTEWENTNVSGQCFIVTNGGESVKLGDVVVGIYDPQAFKEFTDFRYAVGNLTSKYSVMLEDIFPPVARTVLDCDDLTYQHLPEEFESTKTDADGKFMLKKLPKSDFVLFARATRKVLDKTEAYTWRINANEVRSNEQLILSNDNANRWGDP